MKLSDEERKLFFDVILPLYQFVNSEAGIFPAIQTPEEYFRADSKDKVQIRDHVVSAPEWIDKFIDAHLETLPGAHLDILRKWQELMIPGDFYVERFLKKYAILIQEKTDKVYAVLGLTNSFEDFIDKAALPLKIHTVLLPFQGKIVYDGFFKYYSLSFGKGIREDFKQIYLRAKDNGQIIESLDTLPSVSSTLATGAAQEKNRQRQQEVSRLLAEFSEKAAGLRGGSGQPAVYGPAFSLLRATLDIVQTAINTPVNDALFSKIEKVENALHKFGEAIYRSNL